MRRLLRAAALLATCLAPAVQAHLMPAGQGTVRLVGDSAYVVLAVPAALVAMADDDQDGGISAAEIDRHRTRIDAEISQRLQVLSQGQPGRLVFGDLLLSHPEELKGKGADQVTVARRYQWPQPVAGISVRASLAATDKDDTQILMRAIKGEVNETAILTRDHPQAEFFAGQIAVFQRYLLLGAEHILAGADHLLFLLTVLVAGAGWRHWLAVVTTFTVAHSLTLMLAVFGVVQAPPALVEPLIAASIVALALDNLLRRQVRTRHRLVLIFGCGLLHGLGIASVLSEFPISTHNLAASLAGFNIGVELGQIAFVAAALAFLTAFARVAPAAWHGTLVRAASVAAALIGSFWLVERLWA